MPLQFEYCLHEMSLESHGIPSLGILQLSQSAWLDQGYSQVCADDALIISTAASTVRVSTSCLSILKFLEIDCTATPQNTSDDEEEFGEFVSASTGPLQQPSLRPPTKMTRHNHFPISTPSLVSNVGKL
ncbi:hypothetical protein J1614_000305 [Plenodomus biglobosus]|nr:hypothetical protein J1614_000305 [Plenodomus biglobosus]